MFFSGAQSLCWAISHVSEKEKKVRDYKMRIFVGCPQRNGAIMIGGLQKKEKSILKKKWEN